MPSSTPRVVIVGGGFAGLNAAKALRRAPVAVTLVDRCNHHLFQPLLYEVATAALSPADIAEPIRRLLAGQRNTQVLMAEVTGVDVAGRRVHLRDGQLAYDYLVLAPGVRHSYFGHDRWVALAPGLKTVDDALEIRRRFLLAFEAAEREADEAARRQRLTFVIIGGGPTGVELAGTMSELARRAIRRDFRSIDTTTVQVVLVEGRDHVLPTFDPALSARAARDLAALGVDLRLGEPVTDIDEHGVIVGGQRIHAGNVFWAAGVEASPLGRDLDASLDASGRVRVSADLSLPAHPEVFVIGDLATVEDARTGRPVPAVAPAAIQMGRHVASIIRREAEGRRAPRPAFRYVDKGLLATIGRARAVGTIGRLRCHGLAAWLIWALVHIYYLIGFRNRLVVMLRWAWAYLVFARGARLITGKTDLHLSRPREAGGEATERPSD